MANNLIQIKRTSVSGRAANSTTLTNAGELALNMADGILYSTNGTAVFEVGANNTNARITGSLNLDNDKRIYFRTVNTAANAMFVQQLDDNFVFYTTNTSYQPRPVWSIYANSDTSNLSVVVPAKFNSNLDISGGLVANSSLGTSGQVLTSTGSSVYWSSPGAASVNTSAQYTWTNTQTFSANITFGNNIGLSTNTSIYFNGLADANWRIGRNTGGTTKFFYTGNSVDIIAANSSTEGIAFGFTGNSYLETGYAGTFTRLPIYVGNSTVNTIINVSSYSIGTSFVANTTGVYAGVVNGSTIQVGTSFTANATLVNTAAINVTGQVNSATLYATTSANIAASITANTSGLFVANATGTVNAAVIRSGTTFIANSTQVTITGVPLSANSTTGTSGQVLTSNGTTGAPYWATATATVNVAAQFAWTNTHTFTANVTVGNSTTNSAFLISQFGMSNPNTFTMGTVTTNAAFNTVLAGPYTIAAGNTLTITTGSRVVIV